MSDIDWAKAIDVIQNHTVKVATPLGSGTGFLVTYRQPSKFYGIATAYHVIEHAYEWQEPIRLTHAATGASRLFTWNDVVILTRPEQDVAIILFSDSSLGLPTEPLPLGPSDKHLKPAMGIGWLGYPALAVSELCFFQGVVSCFLQHSGSYLVDGVAINGVSGGPAFVLFGESNINLIGLVSAYIPNRATGEVLPGVCMVRAIFPYHDFIARLASFEEARAKEQELAAQQTIESPGTLPAPPPVNDHQQTEEPPTH
jgi:hypothetical protein